MLSGVSRLRSGQQRGPQRRDSSMTPKLSPDERDALVWAGRSIRSGYPSFAALESLLRIGLVAVDEAHNLFPTEEGWKLYQELIAAGIMPIDWNSRTQHEALITRSQKNIAESLMVCSEAAAMRKES